MKLWKSTVLVLVLFYSLPDLLSGQNPEKNFEIIQEILMIQQEAWNRGDIDAFMQAYWKSEKLQFGNADGVTYGWTETLENYKIRYPDRGAMGKLTFRIVDLTMYGDNMASLTGSWELEREKDRPGGHFLLLWKKIDGEWVIVTDHTSQKS